MKITYIQKRFSPQRAEMIRRTNEIIAEYKAQGYDLTLRQIYYQFVSRDWLPNTQLEYARLGGAVSDGRRAGLIDWDAIKDRTRKMEENNHWEDPQSVLGAVAKQFAIDKWELQPFRPEVWIEKEALVSVIEPICQELDIGYLACRGYPSDSVVWLAAQRFLGYYEKGQCPRILHLGDHDPSGIDMTRDIAVRMALLMGAFDDELYDEDRSKDDWNDNWEEEGYEFWDGFEKEERRPAVDFDRQWMGVTRLALNMNQVQQYNPPPNPAKMTDARFRDYRRKFGESSWELDALQPQMISDLIKNAVLDLRDDDLWKGSCAKERIHKDRLALLPGKWESIITSFLEGNGES